MVQPILHPLPCKIALWWIEKLPVSEIKECLQAAGLPTSGNKRTLARRLHASLHKPLTTSTAMPRTSYHWAGTTKKKSSRLQYRQGHQWPQPLDLGPAISRTGISLTTTNATTPKDTHSTQTPRPTLLAPLTRQPQTARPPAARYPAARPPLPAAAVRLHGDLTRGALPPLRGGPAGTANTPLTLTAATLAR